MTPVVLSQHGALGRCVTAAVGAAILAMGIFTAASAQSGGTPPLQATIFLRDAPADATFHPTDPGSKIKIVVQVENISGSPVFTGEGFAATDFSRRLFFTDPRGGTVINTQEQLIHGFSPLFQCLSRRRTLLTPATPVVPLEMLAGPATAPHFFREYVIDDARALYDLTRPGRYSVNARVPLLTFAISDPTAVFDDCDQLEGMRVANVTAVTGRQEFTVMSNSLEFTIAAVPASIVVNPAAASIPAGGSQAFTAEGFDADGASLGDVTGSTTYTISPDGSCSGAICTATTMGPHTITATNGAATATSMLSVTPGASLVLDAAKIWVGLANSDDVGVAFDLLATAKRNGIAIASGQLDSVPGGSSGFNNARLSTIPFAPTSAPVSVVPGDTLSIEVSVRTACVGSRHTSGTARLWFNGRPVDSGSGRDAGSRLGATIAGKAQTYFLRTNGVLDAAAGSSRSFVNMAAGKTCSPFKPFGTWTVTLP